MLDWDYDEDEAFWHCGDTKNGCGVTRLKNSRGITEWWTRVVINGVVEPHGPFKTAKEGRVKAEEEWNKRRNSDNLANIFGYNNTVDI